MMTSLNRHSLTIGVIAMVLLIIGTLVEGGTLVQKLLFVIGSPILGLTAYLNKQKMFTTLQIIVTIGAILAFFNNISVILNYAVMISSSLFGLGYLIKINYFKEDMWWPVGGLGLLIIATGFATSAVDYPIMFNSLLGIGGILVALYSAIGFFHLKVRIAVIWLILNVVFSINPLIIVFSRAL